MSTTPDIESYILAAEIHGEDSYEPDHEVGDLQQLLRLAWTFLIDAQKQRFAEHDHAKDVLSLGGF